ncbi:hypothetical protein AGMMS49975_06010 [Clostridia bacterium]|nr:hypothetical protein AGMMS49975_06010 [Clostridia bacterium]
MKAITILQSFASLIVSGAKHYETRSWATRHRGLIAIHARKSYYPDLLGVGTMREIVKAFGDSCANIERTLPRGAIVAIAELVECWQVESSLHIGNSGDLGTQLVTRDREGYLVKRSQTMDGSSHKPLPEEELLGNFAPGRFAWELQNVKPLPSPIYCSGRQGLWDCGEHLRQTYYSNPSDEMKEFLREYFKPTQEMYQALRKGVDAYARSNGNDQ